MIKAMTSPIPGEESSGNHSLKQENQEKGVSLLPKLQSDGAARAAWQATAFFLETDTAIGADNVGDGALDRIEAHSTAALALKMIYDRS